jgi:hypothetical protein
MIVESFVASSGSQAEMYIRSANDDVCRTYSRLYAGKVVHLAVGRVTTWYQ